MSKWHSFYNILGVDDSSQTPEAAELLGMTSRSYSKFDVITAFENTQKKLRRNIHDKKQLRSLFEFEKQVLTPAMNELFENAALQSEILNAEKTNDNSSSTTDILTVKEEEHSHDTIEIILDSIEQNEDQHTQDSNEKDILEITELLETDEASRKDSFLKYLVILGAIIALCAIIILTFLLHKTFTNLGNKYSTNIENLIDSNSDQFQQDFTVESNEAYKDVSNSEDSVVTNERRIVNSEAIFSKLYKTKGLTAETSLNKTASALISCCDRIAKVDGRNKTFRKQLRRIGLDRKVENGKIEISLKKLTISNANKFSQGQISTLTNLLNRGSQEEKKFSINRLSRIGNKQALDILLNRLRKSYNSSDSRAVISRLIYTLCKWDNNNVKLELANFIGECPSARLASEISLKLMISTGIVVDGNGRMPLKNNEEQREECSIWWQHRLRDFHKKEIATTNLSDPNNVTGTDPTGVDNIKELATNAIFMDMLASQLEVFSWDSQTRPKYSFVDCSKISPKQISNYITNSSERIALELLRITRQYKPSKQDNMELDIINLERRVRVLACNSALQEAVVNLHSTAQTLIVLNKQFDKRLIYKKAIDRFNLEMKNDSKIANNSLEQLQQECYYTLRMLDLLCQQTKWLHHKRN